MTNLNANYVIFVETFYPAGEHNAYFSLSGHSTLGGALRALRAYKGETPGLATWTLYDNRGTAIKVVSSKEDTVD